MKTTIYTVQLPTSKPRQGLQFPVGKVNKLLRTCCNVESMDIVVSIYATAVVEYLTAEIMELAGHTAQENKNNRITPRHIMLAIKSDSELTQLLMNIMGKQSNILPNVKTQLLPKDKKPSKKEEIKNENENENENETQPKETKEQYSFGVNIYKVLKLLYNDLGISKKAMSIMNSFVNDILYRIGVEISKQSNNITWRDVQTAVMLVIPGDLSKHAMSEGQKAMISYYSSNNK